MLEVKDLNLFYGSAQILKDISFSVPKGCMIGLVGANGAGKSSLIKVLAGLVYPKSGQSFLEGKPMAFKNLRLVTGYLIDGPSFYPHLTGLVNLKLLKKINESKVDLATVLGQVGLVDAMHKKVKTYSTGMKQRLAIASTLLRSPELLILDEPFNGLDPGGYKELWDLLLKLNSQGVSIIISSHLLADLEEHSSHFLLLNKGELALEISKKDLDATNRLVSFYFQSPLNSQQQSIFHPYKYELSGHWVQVSIKSNEIAGIIKELVDQGVPPIQMKTENILQQTYFSISR